MRIAVFSDIHANPARLEAVLKAAAAERHDQLWCLGDLVGYGREPAPVVAGVRESADLVIAGNHDFAATGRAQWFLDIIQPWLKATLTTVARELAAPDYEWLRALPAADRDQGIDVMHGSLSEPVSGELENEQLAGYQLLAQNGALSLVGHSHRPLAIGLRDDRLGVYEPCGGEQIDLSQAERWILNPGTAGLRQREQVRDRRPGWMLLDTDQRHATWHRIDD